MMKEVVYFHPKELPAQYDHGVMNYETMGFGPVLASNKTVADELKTIIDSKANLPEKFRKRIEVFFENIDDQNCKRIFEDAAKFVGLEKR
jgi:CDP-glycerol glycerophosphotransferase (TagB/SpsB family)